MVNEEILARSEFLAGITGEFESALEEFVNDSRAQTHMIKTLVNHYGISGDGTLANEIKESLEEKVSEIDRNIEGLERLASELHGASEQYAIFINELKSSMEHDDWRKT